MITLGLDTTGPFCTVALVDGRKLLAEASENIGRGHAERIAPMVQEVLRAADVKPKQIERVAVCTGPGSFTGLRVALAFAKGFALPSKVPIVGLSALDVLAAQADPEKKKSIVSVMDVRRGQLCWAAYEQGRETQPPQTQTVDMARSAILALEPDRIVGDGAHLLGQASEVITVSGYVLAKLAQEREPERYPADPLYSRAPDAKLPGGIDPKLKT